jgi:hypothetical protein
MLFAQARRRGRWQRDARFDYAADSTARVRVCCWCNDAGRFGFWFFPRSARSAHRFARRNERYVTRRNTRPQCAEIARFIRCDRTRDCRCASDSDTATQYFRKLIEEPWGFETKNRLAFNVTVPDRFFPTAAAKQNALEASLAQLQAMPGVKSATVVSPSPMNAPWTLMLFNAEGAPAPEPRGVYTAYSRVPVPGYFKSVGQPILQGRDFNASDTADASLVCIISQSIAKRFWPNDSPIGKRIRWGRLDGTRPPFTIVGVVGDMKAIADPRDGEVLA